MSTNSLQPSPPQDVCSNKELQNDAESRIYRGDGLLFHLSGGIAPDCCCLIQNRLKKKTKKALRQAE